MRCLKVFLCAAALLLAALLAAGPALAATETDEANCDQEEDRELSIAGCTLVIKDQDETSRQRSGAYFNRAKGDQRRAIADFSEAIRLAPKYAPSGLREKMALLAACARGLVQLALGNNDGAIAALSDAIKLAPAFGEVYLLRATTYSAEGE